MGDVRSRQPLYEALNNETNVPEVRRILDSTARVDFKKEALKALGMVVFLGGWSLPVDLAAAAGLLVPAAGVVVGPAAAIAAVGGAAALPLAAAAAATPQGAAAAAAAGGFAASAKAAVEELKLLAIAGLQAAVTPLVVTAATARARAGIGDVRQNLGARFAEMRVH